MTNEVLELDSIALPDQVVHLLETCFYYELYRAAALPTSCFGKDETIDNVPLAHALSHWKRYKFTTVDLDRLANEAPLIICFSACAQTIQRRLPDLETSWP